jgi:hypothetical protein
MGMQLQIVIDCTELAALAAFRANAIHYKIQDPPAGYQWWEDFLQAQGVPQDEWHSASAIVDPDGQGPRIYFQRVPEPKTVKTAFTWTSTQASTRKALTRKNKACNRSTLKWKD